HSIPVEYIELMNEPDSGGEWSTGITGSVYNEVVPAVRTSLDNSGYTNTGIVGPGLSSLSWSNPSTYIASISTATAGKLAAWSTHMWADDYASGCTTGGPCIEAYWPNFGANAKAKNSSIPQFVTEYATKQNVFNGVTYPLPDNYGSWDSNHVFPYYSATNTMPYAVRVYENTLALLNSGANAPFIWQLIDENTEVTSKKKAWGLIDLWGNSKPVYEALKTLCPKIPVGAKVVQPPSQSANNLYVGVFVDGNTVVIGITNKKTSPSSATILLQNAPQNLTVIEAKAFEQVYWGNPSSGDPDVGQTVDKVLNVVASDPCNYSLDVTLAANSTLTVVLRGPKALGDLNGDGVVDFKDISLMAANWLGSFPTADLAPVGGDGIINLLDFTVLAQDWLEDIR
ncbi:MAG: hypothetical protein NTW93_04850, partial [Phycisphaerae bacterium]|nr:hypothetical protein [Phycisphaerae bacterium]